jgi:hypothetical protein
MTSSLDHDPAAIDSSAVSPELVLVDPELARRLQDGDRGRIRQRPPLPALRLAPDELESRGDRAGAGSADQALR